MFSTYAKFFVEFIGYQFFDRKGNIVYKDEVWHEHVKHLSEAIESKQLTFYRLRNHLRKYYLIKDKPGYINGQIFDKRLASLYYEAGNDVEIVMPIKYKEWHKKMIKNLLNVSK